MDPSFRKILSEEPLQRIEAVEYYDTYMPDSSMFYCPVTDDPYKITLEESSLKIASPITEIYKESRTHFYSSVFRGYYFRNKSCKEGEIYLLFT